MSSNKQYGLLVPKKGHGLLRPKLAAFADDSNSDDDGGAGGGDWVKKAFKREAEKSVIKKQTKLEMQRALEQDATVYQYDEVYDQIEEKKAEQAPVKTEKKPRYIQSLLKQAEQRKRERERRLERQVQKEREAEGDEFKDKEAFVTSAYRQKLEEFKKQDEEEKRKEMLEAMVDVTKQKDLSGFYRHLYRQQIGDNSVKAESKISDSEFVHDEKAVDNKFLDSNNLDQQSIQSENVEDGPLKKPAAKKERQYRKRKTSSGESHSEDETKLEVKKHKSKELANPDEDSDLSGESSSESSSSSETDNSGDEDVKDDNENKQPVKIIRSGSEEGEIREIDNNAKVKLKEAVSSNIDENNPREEVVPTVETELPKKSIWEKRTVGVVFEAALQRYFTRKALKEANRG